MTLMTPRSNTPFRPALSGLMVALLAAAPFAHAEHIPSEEGFSGYLNLGMGVSNVESNTISKFSTIDFDNDRISSYSAPNGSETAVIPMVGMELAYTFADTGTQVFLGNSLEDYVSFDFATRAGVRQDVGQFGVLGVSFLKTTVAAEVWEDPFAMNQERQSTNRDSAGYRLIWDHVMDTNLELTFSKREIEIDDEQSGRSLNLTATERATLDRNGDNLRMTAKYTFASQDQRHIISPEVIVTKQDRDGEAVSNTGVSLNMNYIYNLDRWSFVTNTSIAKVDYDDINPVFDDKADANRYGVSFTAFYKEPFGLKDWALNTGVVWYEEDSDIDFYDSAVRQWSVGMLYRF